MAKCDVPDCIRRAAARGLCPGCYSKLIQRSSDEYLQGNARMHMSTIPSGRMGHVEDTRSQHERWLSDEDLDDLELALRRLPSRKREVLKIRLGMCGPVLTYREIGERLGVCRGRAHAIEREAVHAIRRIIKAIRAEKVVTGCSRYRDHLKEKRP